MPAHCSLCQSRALTRFLDLGRQPLANKYPRQEQFADERFFPLEVFFCEDCKNVQLGEMVPRKLMFEDYYYLSSVNGGLVRHFEAMAKGLAEAKFVVDVGSNDGVLLRPLKALGVKALGVEPSLNVSKIANDEGLETLCAFFDNESAKKVLETHGAADVIVASSVFTHLEDPAGFIEAADILLSEDGVLIIEVEYILNMIAQVQFERFYLDRIFYYSISSMKALFERFGMVIAGVDPIAQHGGSLRFTIRRASAASPAPELGELIETELQVLTADALKDFGRQCEELTGKFVQALKDWKAQGVKVAGYGAPARLSTITNVGRIGPALLPFTVDDSPLKQSRHSPGMHIPIVASAELDAYKPEILIVFAYEYIDDIRKKTGNKYTYMMPIPLVELG
jgi:methylation protein EvaC